MSEYTSVDRVEVGYMDKVDFDHELGAASGGNKVYSSVDDLKHQKPCTKDCGIVKVEIRCVEVVQPATPVTQREGFKEQIERNREHKRCGRPIPPWVVPGQHWVLLPTDDEEALANTDKVSMFTVDRVEGETVHWTDGTTESIRELSDDLWRRLAAPRPKRKVGAAV